MLDDNVKIPMKTEKYEIVPFYEEGHMCQPIYQSLSYIINSNSWDKNNVTEKYEIYFNELLKEYSTDLNRSEKIYSRNKPVKSLRPVISLYITDNKTFYIHNDWDPVFLYHHDIKIKKIIDVINQSKYVDCRVIRDVKDNNKHFLSLYTFTTDISLLEQVIDEYYEIYLEICKYVHNKKNLRKHYINYKIRTSMVFNNSKKMLIYRS